MAEQPIDNEDGVLNYKYATAEAIEEALKAGELSQTAFAMGCFWGPDANFGGTPGVVQTRVGYAGASTLEPTYRDIGGHAEVVRVVYDKERTSYRSLLGAPEAWSAPSRTRGQYRSILFVYDREQREVADELVRAIGRDNSPELIEAGEPGAFFWAAEDYHQKYRLRRNKHFVSLAELDFGPRWDEHLYFTKLNGDGRKGFSPSPWLKSLPQEMQKAYRA